MAVPATLRPLDAGVVAIQGKSYWTKGQIVERKATQFASPIRTGAATNADQQFASEVIWDDLTGGVGVINMDERESPDRFTDSTLWTMTKGQVTLLPKRNTISLGTAAGFYPREDRYAVDAGAYVYLFLGAALLRLVKTTLATQFPTAASGASWGTTVADQRTLTSVWSRPVFWKTSVWVPQGTAASAVRLVASSGAYASVTNPSGAGGLVLFSVFDEDLYAVDTAGGIWSTSDDAAAPTWTSRGAIDTLDTDVFDLRMLAWNGSIGTRKILNGVAIHKNNVGDPAPFIFTSRGMMAHDYWTGKVYPSGTDFGDVDPTVGLNPVVWDGSLWYGKGPNANEITNGTRVNRGPNQRDGLVVEKQGTVYAFNESYNNYLVAALNNDGRGISSVMAYNRRGWHTVKGGTPDYANEWTVYDRFKRADSASSVGSDELSNAWTTQTGTMGISGKLAYVVSVSSSKAIATVDLNAADYTVKAVLSTVADGATLFFKYQDTTHYHYVKADTTNGYYVVGYLNGAGSAANNISSFPAPKSGDEILVDVYTYPTSGGSARIADVFVNGIRIYSTSDVDTVIPSADLVGIGELGSSTSARWSRFAATAPNLPQTSMVERINLGPGCPILLFDEGNAVKYIRLPDVSDNPNQVTNFEYESSGKLVLPWFDADLANVQKTILNVQVRTLDCSSTETVKVYYQTDDGDKESDWVQLKDSSGSAATVTTDGVSTLYLDADRQGTSAYKIRLKVVMASGSSARSPKLLFAKIRYLRELDVLYSWDFTLDLSRPQPDGREPDAAIKDLRTDLNTKKLRRFAFTSGETTDVKNVLILNYSGPVFDAGSQHGGWASLAVVETEPSASGLT